MTKRETLMLGMALGAGLMYLLDGERMQRVRGLIRAQAARGANELEELGESFVARGRELRRQADQSFRGATSRLRHHEVEDEVVEARVSQVIGHYVANPSSIRVSAEHGRVTLRGRANPDEMNALVEGVQNVSGVHDVINRLESRENAG